MTLFSLEGEALSIACIPRQTLSCLSSNDEYSEIEKLRSLTLLLALCAAVSYAVPSRGTNGVAFHILSEAGLIAMRMRLYCENSLEGRDPVEQQILRNAFWQLYVCDKTVLVMGGRPVPIHETLFDTQLSLKSSSQSSVTLFEYGPESSGAEIEGWLMGGFRIIRRFWAMTARVIRCMESRSTGHRDKFTELYPEDIAELSKAYFETITLTNCYPAWDVSPAALSPDTNREHYQMKI